MKRSESDLEILVIGAGISGLTTAIALQDIGHRVTVWAKELPEETHSAVAGAIWYPSFGEPVELVRHWASVSLETFQSLAATVADCGVGEAPVRKFFGRRMGPPWWSSRVKEFRLLGKTEVPQGFRSGYACRLPLIEMPAYLERYLPARFRAGGGTIERRIVHRLEEAAQGFSGVVCCAGLGAAGLAGDSALYPIRGDVLRLGPGEDVEVLLAGDSTAEAIYYVPRARDRIVGGSFDRGETSLVPREATRETILRRVSRLVPSVATSRVLEHRVGLRPGRPTVRVERVVPAGQHKPIVFNYGHGAAGVTLSWGCARAVAGFFGNRSDPCSE